MPKRTEYTYGQLEKVLRALGFTCRPGNNDPPGRIYEHPQTGAIIMLPSYPETDKAYTYWKRAAVRCQAFSIMGQSAACKESSS
jgi:hypothetical protein